MELEQKHKIIIGGQLISSITIIVFWILFHISPQLIGDFQKTKPILNPLPLPDFILSGLLLLGALLIYKKMKFGQAVSTIAALFMVALGTVGFNIPTEDGNQMISMVNLLRSGFVNLWCVVFGLYVILKLRKERPKRKANQAT